MSTRSTHRRTRDGELGQAMVIFALMMTAIMAMLALALDMGILLGQRRFDQNGADAAALATGRLMAGEVSPVDDSGAVYFGTPDAQIYQRVRQYAGLDTTNYGSAAPVAGMNQSGFTNRNLLTVTLEYSTSSGQWCSSPAGPRIMHDGAAATKPARLIGGQAVPQCTLYQGVYPPLPTSGQPYRVRVTVSSTTNGLFTPVIGA